MSGGEGAQISGGTCPDIAHHTASDIVQRHNARPCTAELQQALFNRPIYTLIVISKQMNEVFEFEFGFVNCSSNIEASRVCDNVTITKLEKYYMRFSGI